MNLLGIWCVFLLAVVVWLFWYRLVSRPRAGGAPANRARFATVPPGAGDGRAVANDYGDYRKEVYERLVKFESGEDRFERMLEDD